MKKVAILDKDGLVVTVIAANDDFRVKDNQVDVTGLRVAKGWSLVSGEWQAPPARERTRKTRYTVYELQSFLSDDEMILLADSSDPQTVSIVNRLRTFASLGRDLAVGQVAQIVDSLQKRNIITAERKAQMLADLGE
jgi:hypothetical protein